MKIKFQFRQNKSFEKENTKKELNIILKSDVQGSSEALKKLLIK